MAAVVFDMNKFLVFTLLLVACACGGSSSETPPPLEPDPNALPAKAVRPIPPVPKSNADAGTTLESQGNQSEEPDATGPRAVEQDREPGVGAPPAKADAPDSTWGTDPR